MRQFVAYRNRNAATGKLYPLLLNVQSDLISEMETRVVIPLLPMRGARPPTINALAPIIHAEGVAYVLLAPLLAGVDVGQLGEAIADLSGERATILAAIDLLISGI